MKSTRYWEKRQFKKPKASVDDDKINIMRLVEEGSGGYTSVNNKVNDYLRCWFDQMLKELYVELKEKIEKNDYRGFIGENEQDEENEEEIKNQIDDCLGNSTSKDVLGKLKELRGEREWSQQKQQ